MDHSLEYVNEKWAALTAFSKKEELKKELWNEIVYRYNAPHRYYHNLSRISFLFKLMENYSHLITAPATFGFAILYHNIAYDTYMADNAEQSAAIAGVHLSKLKVSPSVIANIHELIIATKNHFIPAQSSQENSLKLFLDFDFAVIAAEPKLYKIYMENIRKEYARYDQETYNQGRRQALQKLLETTHIFKTDVLKQEWESIARENIHSELSLF